MWNISIEYLRVSRVVRHNNVPIAESVLDVDIVCLGFGKELVWLRSIMWFGKVVHRVFLLLGMSVSRKLMVLLVRDINRFQH